MQLRSLLGAIAALAMTAVIGLGLASPSLADTYGPQSGSAHVSATTVQSGGTVIVTGDGFRPNSIVTLTVSQGGDIYITKTALASLTGSVRFSVRLTRGGTNTITLIGTQADGTGALVLTAPRVHVLGSNSGSALPNSGSSGGSSSTGLPGTGGVNLTPLWAGLGLLASGALLVGVARSRRRILV